MNRVQATGGRPVGVLALQGDFAAHQETLRRAGAAARLVKSAAELEGLAGLVLPGGETTTLLNLFARAGMMETIRRFAGRGGTLFGTCAGVILLAREVLSPPQASLGLADVTVERNAYGRQRESFEASLEVPGLGGPPLAAVFIRAPRIVRVGPGVEVLASYEGSPVLARQGQILLATFHPELTDDLRIHRLFLEMAAGDGRAADGRSAR